MTYRFQVFARTMAVERVDGAWRCWLVGADGKRSAAELAIRADVAADELAQYLYDIYHEEATPTNGDVVEIGRA